MFRRKVTAPDGRKWTLGRHWLPRRKRFKKADITDVGPDGGFLDIGGDDLGIFGVIIAVIVGVFLASSSSCCCSTSSRSRSSCCS